MTDYPARVERFAEKFLKKVAGMSEIDDALRKLDKLTQEEHRMATAQALKATHGVRNNMDIVVDGVWLVFPWPPVYSLLTRFGLDTEQIKEELRQVVVHVDDQKCSSHHNASVLGHCV